MAASLPHTALRLFSRLIWESTNAFGPTCFKRT